MIPESVYSKYSQAMFDIAQSDNSLDTVLADMKTVRTVMRENKNTYSIFIFVKSAGCIGYAYLHYP